jgi:hypothetical protein
MEFTPELLPYVILGYSAAIVDIALVTAVVLAVKSAFRKRRFSQPVHVSTS